MFVICYKLKSIFDILETQYHKVSCFSYYIIFNKRIIFVYTFSLILNKIIREFSSFIIESCGSECLDNGNGNVCKCGLDEFQTASYGNANYCCSIANCTKNENGDVTCPYGQLLPYENNCNEKCPSSKTNYIAISSTCGFHNGCPTSKYYSIICTDGLKNNSFDSFCSTSYSCSKPLNSKWSFDQCYERYFVR